MLSRILIKLSKKLVQNREYDALILLLLLIIINFINKKYLIFLDYLYNISVK